MITGTLFSTALNKWSASAVHNLEHLILGLLAGIGIALLYTVLLKAGLAKTIPFGRMPRMFLSALLLFLVDRYLSQSAFLAALVAFLITQIIYFALLYRRLKRG